MMDITLMQVAPADHVVQGFYARLAPAEQRRADGMRRAEDRCRHVLTRGALRMLLGMRLGVGPADVVLALAARGKPVLDASTHGERAQSLHFNVSHSGDWAAIAMAGYPVGIDIEQARDLDVTALGAQVFDAATCRRMADQADPRDFFFRQWTAREAQWKAQGVGLAGADGARAHEAPSGAQVLSLDVAPGYYGAVCVLGAPRACHATDVHMTTCRAADMLAEVND